MIVAVSESLSSCSLPVDRAIFTFFLSLSTFFTVPEISLLAVADEEELDGLVEAVLEGDWLDGLCVADDDLSVELVPAEDGLDWLDELWPIEDWPDELLELD